MLGATLLFLLLGAGFIAGWFRGLPPRANHSRIWRQAQADREIRDQLANCERPSPAGEILFHAGQYASEAQHDHV